MIRTVRATLAFFMIHFQLVSGGSFAWALPQGEQVVAGSAQFDRPDDVTMNITTGDKAIIEYTGFDIDQPETVNFFQSSASSIALNRITGGNPSSILGRLNATGKIFLINPNGILFGAGSQVDTAGFVASVLDIANDDFLSGNYRFSMKPGFENATVINHGLIKVASGGFAGLLGPQVENDGVVIADQGKIVMASGEKATLDFDGNGLINFMLEGELENALVSNTGTLQAHGGEVLLTARAAESVINNVVNNEGLIDASSVVNDGGIIRLMGEGGGITANSGTLDASSQNGKGGTVQVLGEKVGFFDGSVNASGTTGGGTVLIGGDREGKNPDIRNASQTYMSEQAAIHADALENGNGGKVIVWSNDGTQVYGHVTARGGAQGGNGGFIETSGAQWLDVSVAPDVSAALGIGGEWLLDPNNLEIVAGSGNTNINAATPFVTTNDTAQLGVGLIVTALGSGSVTISTGTGGGNSQAGNLTWTANMDFNTIGTNKTLTLNAHNDITLNGSISQSGTPDDYLNLVFNANSDNSGGGSIVINNTIATGGGSVTFQDGVYLKYGIDTSTSQAGLPGGNITFQDQVIIASGVTIVLTTTGVTSDGNISFASLLDSGNSYSLVSDTTRTWQAAKTNAASGDGSATNDTYLATITSSLENSIVTATANNGAAWLGGADTAVEGAWRWVTGPEGLESSGAGRQFWSGTSTGSAVGGSYTNWNGGEPNNAGNEDALQLGAGTGGQWNDLPDNSNGSKLNYVKETNLADTALTIAAGTGTVTFSGAVGGNKTLGAVTINSAGAVNVNAAFTNSGAISITNSGTLTTAAAGDIITAGTFAHSGTGTATLSGDITATNNSITLNRAVTLGGNVVMNAGTSTITANSTVAAGANVLTLTADEIDLLGGADSVSGTSTLLLQTSTASATIGIGGGTGTLSIDDTDLAALANGFSGITIGRSDGTGDIEISSSAFRDPVTIRSPSGDGDISMTGSITGDAMGTLTIQAGDQIDTSGSADISSSSGALNIVFSAALDPSGPGVITLGVGTDFNSNGGSITLTSDDISMNGSINSGSGTTTLLTQTAGTTMSLGSTASNYTLAGPQLQNITAANLVMGDGTNGTITVDNISAANSNNISGTLTLNATRDNAQILFANNASTFNAITANADAGIDVDVAVTADTGAMTFDGDADNAADTNDNIDLTAMTLTSAGIMSLTATTGGILLSGGSGTTTTLDANGDALLTLGTITDTNNANLTANSEGGITLAGATSLGSGTYTFTADNDSDNTSTLTVSGAITGSSALTFSGGGTNDTLDMNADVSSGTLTIQNFGTVDLAGGVDLTSAGALAANSSVTAINLSGADATTNTITGSGDAAVNLASVTDTNNVNLTVSSQGTLTLAGASNLGTGNYSFTFDSDNDAFTNMTLNGTISGNSALTFQSGGSTTGDAFTLSADITGNSIDIHDIDSLLLGTSVDLTANSGDLYAYSNVNTISFQGATGTTNIFDGNGDAFVRLGTFSDNNAPNVTVTSEGDIIWNGAVSLGTGNYNFTADNDNDGSGSVTVNGTVTGSAVLTLSGGGTGTGDTINLNQAISAGSITIQNAATASLGGNLSTDGGAIIDSAASSTLAVSITIDSEQGNDGSAGLVNLGSTVLSGGGDAGLDLTINTATTAAGQNGGAVSLSTVNGAGGSFINGVSVNTSAGTGGTAGTVTLNGSISLDDDVFGGASSLSVTGNGDLVIGSTLTIDTEQNNRDGVSGGSINFASSNVYAGSAGLTLTLNTANSNAGESAGAVTLGLVDDNAGANQFLNNLSVTAVSASDGAINLGNNVTVNNGSLTLNGDAVLGGAVVLTAGTGTITLGSTSSIAASSNALTMTADEIELNGAASSIGGSGALVLQPSTTSKAIALGGAGGTAALDLTSAEIGTLADGFSSITIGHSDGAGILTVGAVTFLDPATIRMPSGAIYDNANDSIVDITAPSLTLIAGGGIGLSNSSLDYTVTTVINADSSAGNADIFLDAIGDAPIGYIDAGTGNITMNATGAMDDDVVDKVLDFNGTQVILTAPNGVGNIRELELLVQNSTTTTTGNYTATNTSGSSTEDVTAGGDILDDSDSGETDFSTSGDTTLTANGIIGTTNNPIEVDIGGELYIQAGGRQGLISAMINGTTSDGQIHLVGDPEGLVLFNNRIVGGQDSEMYNDQIGTASGPTLRGTEGILMVNDVTVEPSSTASIKIDTGEGAKNIGTTENTAGDSQPGDVFELFTDSELNELLGALQNYFGEN